VEIIKADICVIGAGSAGLSVAAGAAQLGRKVVLVEKGEMGGECLNTGCVPSKSLLAAANLAEAMRGASVFGLTSPPPAIDAAGVRSHIRDAITTLEPNDSEDRFVKLGVRVIRASARFLDPLTIEAGMLQVRARRYVIATGSRPAVPPIPGLDRIAFFTNENIFEKDFVPPHLIVIGGGPVGIELAQAHRRLGSQVTIVEADRILPREDVHASSIVCDALVSDGIRFLESTQATSIAPTESGIRLQIVSSEHSEIVEGTHLLLAAGRKPNIEQLDLEKAAIAHDEHGIKTDHKLKTTNRRVYAIGDVTHAPRFTHVASYHAGLVIRHALFKLPVRADHSAIPRVTYSDPEVAHVGLTEEEARAGGEKVTIAEAKFADNDRAVTARRRDGGIRVVVGRGGRIRGATIVGHNAGELILPWVMAIKDRKRLRDLTGLIVPYPTLSEISKRAASNYYAPALFSNRARTLVRVLSWF